MFPSDLKGVAWIGYCSTNAIYMESFLNENKIPVVSVSSRAPIVYFPELSEAQLACLEEAGWKMRIP